MTGTVTRSKKGLYPLLTRDECLAFLKDAIENPPSTPSIHVWIAANLDSLESTFDRRDFLKFKHRGLIGARDVLERLNVIETTDISNDPIDFDEKHCRHCGGDLFWALAGKTTKEEIVGYANLIGSEEIANDEWIHPGVYCSNGCTFRMFNIAKREPGDAPHPWIQEDG